MKNAYVFMCECMYACQKSICEKSVTTEEKFCLADLPRFLFLKEEILKRMRLDVKNQTNMAPGHCVIPYKTIYLKYLSFHIPTTYL